MSNAFKEAQEKVERPFEGGTLAAVATTDEVDDVDVPEHEPQDD